MGMRGIRNIVFTAFAASLLACLTASCGSAEVNTAGMLDEDGRYLVTEALRFQQTGNWYPARMRWEELLETYPEYPDGWYNCGLCYDQLMDANRGAECFEKALALDPSNPRIKYALANDLLVMRQTKRGHQLMIEVTENDKYFALGFYGLAASERTLNRFQAAQTAIDRCLEIIGEGYSDPDPTEYPWARDAYWLKILVLLDIDPEDRNGKARNVSQRMERLGFQLRPAEKVVLAGRASATKEAAGGDKK